MYHSQSGFVVAYPHVADNVARLLPRVVYLSPADNSAGPVWSRPHDVNRTVMTSQNLSHRVPNAWSRSCALVEGTRDPFILTIPKLSAAYTACGCDHGGTRNINTSRSVHTRSVRPAAIDGV